MPWWSLTYKIIVCTRKSSLSLSPLHTHEHKQIQIAWGRQSRMDLGTSFRLDALIFWAGRALLCPQAFPNWPVEWVTYPDSNTVWQGDLETDVPCHWHDAVEEMASRVRTQYICVSTKTEGEGDREGNSMLEWQHWKEGGGGQWVVEVACVGVGGS